MQAVKLYTRLFIFLCFLSSNILFAQGASDVLPNTIIVKLKPEYSALGGSTTISESHFLNLFQSVGGTDLHKKFPAAKSVRIAANSKWVDLTLVYEFSYTSQLPLEKVIQKFQSLNLFQYVEPHSIPKTCYVPSDTSYLFQYHISLVRADSAWDVNTTTARGDTNMVIGITDTGVELTHPDLISNIKLNYDDPLGGGDDDNDGYIDNYAGWDLGENDNNPSFNVNAHGVHVSGIAAAKTDNVTGVAGVGFNCKFLPVKISNASGSLTKAYEGIAYAAEQGCKIINCSWGGPGGGQLGQDVVDYATYNFDALVVAAAGNNGAEMNFYPASYQNVISVANTDFSDIKATTSNYGYNIDVSAPGESVYATYPINIYNFQSGTSMASPVVAGAAAIVRSFYPTFNAFQAGEQLKVTADNHYSLNNSNFENKLGTGRVNLYRALTQTAFPSVVMTQRTVTDENDENYNSGDTLTIFGDYTNYLAPITNLQIALISSSPYVNIIDGTTSVGAINTMGTVNNNLDVFKVELLAGIPNNYSLVFELKYTDAASNYSHSEFFTVMLNPDYINIAINDVATTITSIGRIGYRTNQQTQGLGFTYNGSGTLFYEAGLMLGANSSQVSDGIRNSGAADNDFQSINVVQELLPAVVSDFDVDGKMNDALALSPLFVDIDYKAHAWTSAGNRKYVMLEYTLKNTGITTLTNLFAGVFADWDIDAATFTNNRAAVDGPNKLGYVFNTASNGLYAGVKVLSATAPATVYSIDNVSGGNGGIDIFNGYDGADKYMSLSTNRLNAGVGGTGNDVAQVVSTGPFTVLPNDSVHFAFAILAGDSLLDLQTSAINAQGQYDAMTTVTNIQNIQRINSINLHPNPASNQAVLTINSLDESTSELFIYTSLGEQVYREKKCLYEGNNAIAVDLSRFLNGIYYCQVLLDGKKYSAKMIVLK